MNEDKELIRDLWSMWEALAECGQISISKSFQYSFDLNKVRVQNALSGKKSPAEQAEVNDQPNEDGFGKHLASCNCEKCIKYWNKVQVHPMSTHYGYGHKD